MALDGQKIVVIGGSSGMGLATARAAALEGAEVTIASSRQERVDTALGELPDGCVGTALDVRDETQVAALFERVGELDHLAFTAGDAFRPRPLVDLSLSDAQRDPRRSLLGCGRRHQARSAPDQARRINRVDHRHRRPATGPRRSACRRRRWSRRGPRPGTGGRTRPRPRQRGQGRRFSHAALGRRPRAQREALFARLAQGTLTGTVGEPEQIAAAHPISCRTSTSPERCKQSTAVCYSPGTKTSWPRRAGGVLRFGGVRGSATRRPRCRTRIRR